jgi:hypothetical protein
MQATTLLCTVPSSPPAHAHLESQTYKTPRAHAAAALDETKNKKNARGIRVEGERSRETGKLCMHIFICAAFFSSFFLFLLSGGGLTYLGIICQLST